jgi:large exoprotein involved in heme utilization and adhesion
VQITTPDIDPGKGLVPLNADTVDVARLVSDNICARTANSSFVTTGRGGMASSPNDKLSSDTNWEDWRLSRVDKQQAEQQSKPVPDLRLSSTPVVEAQEWIVNNSGHVELITYVPNAETRNFGSLSNQCQPAN